MAIKFAECLSHEIVIALVNNIKGVTVANFYRGNSRRSSLFAKLDTFYMFVITLSTLALGLTSKSNMAFNFFDARGAFVLVLNWQGGSF